MSDLSWIDEQLRNVAVPQEALERLREIPALGDRELDHLLRDAALPRGMLDRLRAISTQDDVEVDDELQTVKLPEGLLVRLRKHVRWQAWRTRAAQLAVAASLMFVLGGGVALLLQNMQPPGNAVVNNGRPEGPGGLDGGGDKLRPNPRPAPKPNPAELVLGPNGGGKAHPTPQPAPDPAPPSPELPDNKTPSPEAIAEIPPGVDWLTQTYTPSPDLNVVQSPGPRGISGPRVKGYDIAFELLQRGAHPFVQPGRNPLLRESQAPIWTSTASYEATLRALAARQSINPTQVHVEDFLAAMDYGFAPAAPGQLAIRTAAGPNPFAADSATGGQSLLQIGVQAGAFPRGFDGGVRLTLAVDASAEMLVGGRWQAAGRAIADMALHMGPRDRLSLVVFAGRSSLIVKDANRETLLGEGLEKLQSITPRGAADLGAAIETAAEIADDNSPITDGAPPPSRRLILLTDGLVRIDPVGVARASKSLAPLIGHGLGWEVIDVRPTEIANPQLEELARLASVSVRRAPTLHDLETRLRAAIAGRSQVVAHAISLKINFNPDAVESYRLIGHEATALGNLESAAVEGQLHADEAATALYAVELKPDGADEVASVELSWREPGSEEIHRLKQPVGRLQVAPSWLETPLSLQSAALAGQVGETLRGSPYVPNSQRALDQAADLARQANPALQKRASFAELRGLIDAARANRTATSGRT